MAWRTLQYIRHLFFLKHRNGHGIHSPYVFELVNGILFNSRQWEVPLQVREVHRIMKKDCSLIPREEPPGVRADDSDLRSISSFVKKASVRPGYGALLFRMARWFEPDAVVELGSGLGISTAYLRAGAPEVPFHAVEGGKIRSLMARQVIYRSKLNEVEIHTGDIGQLLPGILNGIPARFLAFVDGNHHYEPTMKYLDLLLQARGEEAVIVMDDIYWSKGMQKAWREIIARPEVRVSVDLFHMGILLLRSDLDRARLKIKF